MHTYFDLHEVCQCSLQCQVGMHRQQACKKYTRPYICMKTKNKRKAHTTSVQANLARTSDRFHITHTHTHIHTYKQMLKTDTRTYMHVLFPWNFPCMHVHKHICTMHYSHVLSCKCISLGSHQVLLVTCSSFVCIYASIYAHTYNTHMFLPASISHSGHIE
jgi:hypothetical protein